MPAADRGEMAPCARCGRRVPRDDLRDGLCVVCDNYREEQGGDA